MIPPIFAIESEDRWKSDIRAEQRSHMSDRETD